MTPGRTSRAMLLIGAGGLLITGCYAEPEIPTYLTAAAEVVEDNQTIASYEETHGPGSVLGDTTGTPDVTAPSTPDADPTPEPDVPDKVPCDSSLLGTACPSEDATPCHDYRYVCVDEGLECVIVNSEASFCVVDGICVDAGQRQVGNSCHVCDPGSSETSWSLLDDGTLCETAGLYGMCVSESGDPPTASCVDVPEWTDCELAVPMNQGEDECAPVDPWQGTLRIVSSAPGDCPDITFTGLGDALDEANAPEGGWEPGSTIFVDEGDHEICELIVPSGVHLQSMGGPLKTRLRPAPSGDESACSTMIRLMPGATIDGFSAGCDDTSTCALTVIRVEGAADAPDGPTMVRHMVIDSGDTGVLANHRLKFAFNTVVGVGTAVEITSTAAMADAAAATIIDSIFWNNTTALVAESDDLIIDAHHNIYGKNVQTTDNVDDASPTASSQLAGPLDEGSRPANALDQVRGQSSTGGDIGAIQDGCFWQGESTWPPTCVPDCGSATCGDDGCGGSCGECGDDAECVDGTCIDNPTPESDCCSVHNAPGCDDATCRDIVCKLDPTAPEGNPNGGLCCGASWSSDCADLANAHCGVCGGCESDCTGKTCGDDGCGGSCGTCESDDLCIVAACEDDGCVNQPVTCEGGQVCDSETGECGDPPLPCDAWSDDLPTWDGDPSEAYMLEGKSCDSDEDFDACHDDAYVCVDDELVCQDTGDAYSLCEVDGHCAWPGEHDPTNICMVCNPPQSATTWSPRPTDSLCGVDGQLGQCTESDDPGEDPAFCAYEDTPMGACPLVAPSTMDDGDCTPFEPWKADGFRYVVPSHEAYGFCGSQDDKEIMAEADLSAFGLDALAGCSGEPDLIACLQGDFEEDLGLSDGCAGCMANATQCKVDHCEACLTDSDSEDCLTCFDEHCAMNYHVCTEGAVSLCGDDLVYPDLASALADLSSSWAPEAPEWHTIMVAPGRYEACNVVVPPGVEIRSLAGPLQTTLVIGQGLECTHALSVHRGSQVSGFTVRCPSPEELTGQWKEEGLDFCADQMVQLIRVNPPTELSDIAPSDEVAVLDHNIIGGSAPVEVYGDGLGFYHNTVVDSPGVVLTQTLADVNPFELWIHDSLFWGNLSAVWWVPAEVTSEIELFNNVYGENLATTNEFDASPSSYVDDQFDGELDHQYLPTEENALAAVLGQSNDGSDRNIGATQTTCDWSWDAFVPCEDVVCANGGYCGLEGGCTCAVGWVGPACEEVAPEPTCDDSPMVDSLGDPCDADADWDTCEDDEWQCVDGEVVCVDVDHSEWLCQIDGVCLWYGDPNPANTCQRCDTDQHVDAWSDVAESTLCEDPDGYFGVCAPPDPDNGPPHAFCDDVPEWASCGITPPPTSHSGQCAPLNPWEATFGVVTSEDTTACPESVGTYTNVAEALLDESLAWGSVILVEPGEYAVCDLVVPTGVRLQSVGGPLVTHIVPDNGAEPCEELLKLKPGATLSGFSLGCIGADPGDECDSNLVAIQTLSSGEGEVWEEDAANVVFNIIEGGETGVEARHPLTFHFNTVVGSGVGVHIAAEASIEGDLAAEISDSIFWAIPDGGIVAESEEIWIEAYQNLYGDLETPTVHVDDSESAETLLEGELNENYIPTDHADVVFGEGDDGRDMGAVQSNCFWDPTWACGDAVCEAGLETLASCAEDCTTCGDGICAGGEEAGNCPGDCIVCGDGICHSADGETIQECVADCGSSCCDASGTSGCDDPQCESAVCDQFPTCCEAGSEWTDTCANLALLVCESCGCAASCGDSVCGTNGCDGSCGECDDQNPCTDDSCSGGQCLNTPKDCDDTDPCTDDICTDGECNNPAVDCDDLNVCTDDVCSAGDCYHYVVDCDDDDPCTDDSCSAEAQACVSTTINCNDSNDCTTDSCADGQCSNTEIDCDDTNPCTVDSCVDGSCEIAPVVCTGGATCVDGECVTSSCDLLVEMQTEQYGGEISWTIDDAGGEQVAENEDAYTDYLLFTSYITLESGDHTLNMVDSYGDGWNGAKITLSYLNTEIPLLVDATLEGQDGETSAKEASEDFFVDCSNCVQSCDAKNCGPDGCGGSCGACAAEEFCNDGVCGECQPNCAGKQCGTDGCGGTCGTCTTPSDLCAVDSYCTVEGYCAIETSCADDEYCEDDACLPIPPMCIPPAPVYSDSSCSDVVPSLGGEAGAGLGVNPFYAFINVSNEAPEWCEGCDSDSLLSDCITYTNLVDALAIAPPGSVVLVHPGTYEISNLDIAADKTIRSLAGPTETTLLVESHVTTGITLNSQATLEGFRITSNSNQDGRHYVVVKAGSTGSTLRYNIIEGKSAFEEGIVVEGSQSKIEHNTFVNVGASVKLSNDQALSNHTIVSNLFHDATWPIIVDADAAECDQTTMICDGANQSCAVDDDCQFIFQAGDNHIYCSDGNALCLGADPQLTATHTLPDGSPLIGAADDGRDIGAPQVTCEWLVDENPLDACNDEADESCGGGDGTCPPSTPTLSSDGICSPTSTPDPNGTGRVLHVSPEAADWCGADCDTQAPSNACGVYQSVEHALQNALEGDLVLVHPGVYVEEACEMLVPHNVHVRSVGGPEETVLQRNPSCGLILKVDAGATVEGFTFTSEEDDELTFVTMTNDDAEPIGGTFRFNVINTVEEANQQIGIELIGDNHVVDNNSFVRQQRAIFISDDNTLSDHTITDNLFTDCYWPVILEPGAADCAGTLCAGSMQGCSQDADCQHLYQVPTNHIYCSDGPPECSGANPFLDDGYFPTADSDVLLGMDSGGSHDIGAIQWSCDWVPGEEEEAHWSNWSCEDMEDTYNECGTELPIAEQLHGSPLSDWGACAHPGAYDGTLEEAVSVAMWEGNTTLIIGPGEWSACDLELPADFKLIGATGPRGTLISCSQDVIVQCSNGSNPDCPASGVITLGSSSSALIGVTVACSESACPYHVPAVLMRSNDNILSHVTFDTPEVGNVVEVNVQDGDGTEQAKVHLSHLSILSGATGILIDHSPGKLYTSLSVNLTFSLLANLTHGVAHWPLDMGGPVTGNDVLEVSDTIMFGVAQPHVTWWFEDSHQGYQLGLDGITLLDTPSDELHEWVEGSWGFDNTALPSELTGEEGAPDIGAIKQHCSWVDSPEPEETWSCEAQSETFNHCASTTVGFADSSGSPLEQYGACRQLADWDGSLQAVITNAVDEGLPSLVLSPGDWTACNVEIPEGLRIISAGGPNATRLTCEQPVTAACLSTPTSCPDAGVVSIVGAGAALVGVHVECSAEACPVGVPAVLMKGTDAALGHTHIVGMSTPLVVSLDDVASMDHAHVYLDHLTIMNGTVGVEIRHPVNPAYETLNVHLSESVLANLEIGIAHASISNLDGMGYTADATVDLSQNLMFEVVAGHQGGDSGSPPVTYGVGDTGEYSDEDEELAEWVSVGWAESDYNPPGALYGEGDEDLGATQYSCDWLSFDAPEKEESWSCEAVDASFFGCTAPVSSNEGVNTEVDLSYWGYCAPHAEVGGSLAAAIELAVENEATALLLEPGEWEACGVTVPSGFHVMGAKGVMYTYLTCDDTAQYLVILAEGSTLSGVSLGCGADGTGKCDGHPPLARIKGSAATLSHVVLDVSVGGTGLEIQPDATEGSFTADLSHITLLGPPSVESTIGITILYPPAAESYESFSVEIENSVIARVQNAVLQVEAPSQAPAVDTSQVLTASNNLLIDVAGPRHVVITSDGTPVEVPLSGSNVSASADDSSTLSEWLSTGWSEEDFELPLQIGLEANDGTDLGATQQACTWLNTNWELPSETFGTCGFLDSECVSQFNTVEEATCLATDNDEIPFTFQDHNDAGFALRWLIQQKVQDGSATGILRIGGGAWNLCAPDPEGYFSNQSVLPPGLHIPPGMTVRSDAGLTETLFTCEGLDLSGPVHEELIRLDPGAGLVGVTVECGELCAQGHPTIRLAKADDAESATDTLLSFVAVHGDGVSNAAPAVSVEENATLNHTLIHNSARGVVVIADGNVGSPSPSVAIKNTIFRDCSVGYVVQDGTGSTTVNTNSYVLNDSKNHGCDLGEASIDTALSDAIESTMGDAPNAPCDACILTPFDDGWANLEEYNTGNCPLIGNGSVYIHHAGGIGQSDIGPIQGEGGCIYEAFDWSE